MLRVVWRVGFYWLVAVALLAGCAAQSRAASPQPIRVSPGGKHHRAPAAAHGGRINPTIDSRYMERHFPHYTGWGIL